jgi:hypothetical protein
MNSPEKLHRWLQKLLSQIWWTPKTLPELCSLPREDSTHGDELSNCDPNVLLIPKRLKGPCIYFHPLEQPTLSFQSAVLVAFLPHLLFHDSVQRVVATLVPTFLSLRR